jgi:hypothetical protein
MDNKTKILCVAIAVLLVSNGYLLYRLGNAEGKAEPVAGSNEEAKANTPIGKYIPEGDGFKFDSLTPFINKLYLRDDGKVEINDEINGTWYRLSSQRDGHYTINCTITEFTIKVDDKYLSITGWWDGGTSSQSNLIEKDFIRYKRVE